MQRDGRVSTRVSVNTRSCVRELVTRDRTFTVFTYAAVSVPIMGMQVAKQVPFIHVRRALVAYHLQFPIYHLPSSTGRERLVLAPSLSLSLSRPRRVRGEARRDRDGERRKKLVTSGYTREIGLLHFRTMFHSLCYTGCRWSLV